MAQKFKRGERVYITNKMPIYMRHFHHGCDAIVCYTYKQKYGGGKEEEKEYCLLILNPDGTVYGGSSWYEENQLSIVDSNTKAGKAMIEAYEYTEVGD